MTMASTSEVKLKLKFQDNILK